MGLAVVGATSLVGAASHWRTATCTSGLAHLRRAGDAGTYAGARLSAFVPGAVQLSVFAVVMLVAAWFMFRNGRREACGSGGPAEAGGAGARAVAR